MRKILLFIILCFCFSNLYSQSKTQESSISKLFPKEIQEEMEKRDKLIISKYGKEYGQKIIYGQIAIGMTEPMMFDAWGKPDSVDTSEFSLGIFRTFKYNENQAIVITKNGQIVFYDKFVPK
ncbi:hypothetical protein [Aquiflexum sp.]|uniref:hypothetical protein n=1 Tax=Aquiflexum sp. TaxID=1872584 RepID=UPI003593D353